MEKQEITDLIALNSEEIREILPFIIEKQTPLRRKKKDGTYAFIPHSEFDQYIREGDQLFYIEREVLENFINERKSISKTTPIVKNERSKSSVKEEYIDKGFKSELKISGEMDMTERIQSLVNSNYMIKKMQDDGKKFNPETINETTRIFTSTLCLNKSTFEENILKPVADEQLTRIMTETHSLINNLINMLAKGKSTFADLAMLEYVQTGSPTLNHMNRILIRFISFLFFYNSYFVKYSNEVKRFRAHFNTKFLPYYNRIMNNSQKVTLEIVFKDGIAPISNRQTFLEYAMGGLMHDIGKIPEIAYHDSDEGFDPVKARRHVFDTYNMLLQTKKFSNGVIAVGLLHHDYYGAPYGYNQVKTFVGKFSDRREQSRDVLFSKNLISYNILDVAYGNSISYFPGKVLEIIDIYDAMTDPDKAYRKSALQPEEALFEIRRQFLEKKNPGIDPILFNIFSDFLHSSALIKDPSSIESVKI